MTQQDRLNKYWVDLVNSTEFVNTERNWAKYIRAKFDALREVGFSENQSIELIKAVLKVVNNQVLIKGEISNDE